MKRNKSRSALALLSCTLAVLSCNCRNGTGSTAADESGTPGGGARLREQPASPESWALAPGEEGTLRVLLDRAEVAVLRVHFFGKDYAYAGGEGQAMGLDGESPRFGMDVPSMGIKVEGRIDTTGPGQATITWITHASRAVDGVVGAVIEMNVAEQTAAMGGARTELELTDGGAGWAWRTGAGEAESDALHVRFEPALVHTYLEPGSTSVVRGVLFGESLAAGKHTQKMIVDLPTGGRVRPPISVQWGPEDYRSWHAGTLDWDRTPVDVGPAVASVHHRPAGKHGVIQAVGDHFEFADGTPARFWGTNVVAYTIFHSEQASACHQADRLAAFGYNLVRLHHHDSGWVEPNVFKPGPTTQELSPASMEKLDRWIQCLQDRGIYVWLDLHTGRQFKPGDSVPGYSELAAQENGQAKGYSYVNARVEFLMQEFARKFLGHRNVHTGVRYADDPSVIGVLITNENDMTQHHGNLMNSSAGNGEHRAMLEQAAAGFLAKSGLPKDESLDAWRLGSGKVLMNQLEHRFFADAITNIRGTGYKGPIAGTNMWGDNRHWSLPSLTTGDVIDVHAYDGELRLDTNPHLAPTFVHFIASASVEGYPVTVSEWNLPVPVRDRYVGPLWVAAIGALQGWDAPMHYAYSMTKLEQPYNVDAWSALYDPGQMALMPAAAVAFRLGHILPAKTTFRVQLDKAATYGAETSVLHNATIRTLIEQSRIVIALPDIEELDWDTPRPATPGATTVTDLHHDYLPATGSSVISDTGQIRRDWEQGILTVDTPGSQWAVGWLGGRTITLSDVELNVTTKHAGVTFTALDGAPLRSSKSILVSVVARVVTDGTPRLPGYAEPVRGTFSIESTLPGQLQLVPQMRGHIDPVPPSAPIAGRKQGTRWVFDLPAAVPTHWFLLQPAP